MLSRRSYDLLLCPHNREDMRPIGKPMKKLPRPGQIKFPKHIRMNLPVATTMVGLLPRARESPRVARITSDESNHDLLSRGADYRLPATCTDPALAGSQTAEELYIALTATI